MFTDLTPRAVRSSKLVKIDFGEHKMLRQCNFRGATRQCFGVLVPSLDKIESLTKLSELGQVNNNHQKCQRGGRRAFKRSEKRKSRNSECRAKLFGAEDRNAEGQMMVGPTERMEMAVVKTFF